MVNGLWRVPGDFGKARELARGDASISPTVGIHPHDCAQVPEGDWARCAEIAADPRVVAVGETGLDFHYDHSPRDRQRDALRWSIALARKVAKPLVVHVREADPEVLRISRGGASRGGRADRSTASAGTATLLAPTSTLASIFRSLASLPSRMPTRSARPLAWRRSTACSSRPIAPIWRRCRIAAGATSRRTSWRSPASSRWFARSPMRRSPTPRPRMPCGSSPSRSRAYLEPDTASWARRRRRASIRPL